MLNFIRKIRLPQNPYLLFSPLFLFYILFVLIFQHDFMFGDEDRYLSYAHNLINGHYASSDITLGNGPGYSIILTPFVAFDLPLLSIKLMNPVFHYLSVVFLYKLLRHISSFRVALIFSLFWACYYNSFDNMYLIHSEIFSSFLVSIVLYLIVKLFIVTDPKKTKKYLVLTGLSFGYLVLTKVIFGYILLCMLGVALILWLLNRRAVNHRKGLTVLVISFLTVLPYLIYTYNLTGKPFYWSTTGGENLYWMSTDYPDEYGSWIASPNHSVNFVSAEDSIKESQESGYLNFVNKEDLIPGIEDSIKLHHQKDFEEILKDSHTGVERDDAFKRIAIRNIKANPGGYIKNCFSNVGRILFNYPYSYSKQKPTTLLRFPLNGFIAILMLFCLIPTIINWRKVFYPVRFILFIVLLYLGGSVLASAEVRMFSIIVPILLYWIAYMLVKTIKVKLKFKSSEHQP